MANDNSTTTHHPEYDKHFVDWEKMRDCYRGERTIKNEGRKYLPPTPGQLADGMKNTSDQGYQNYLGYKTRARFPDFVAQTIEALIGIMHHKPPTIELPEAMEGLREAATVKGESLELLLRRINEMQLVTGRLGLLADVPNESPVNTLPYIAMYQAEDIQNWDDGQRENPVLQNLNLVVLNESGYVRKDKFQWEHQNQKRVLILGDIALNEGKGSDVIYRVGVFEDENDFNESALVEPSIGNNTLNELPFVVVNSKDIVPDPDDPPLLGLADLALAVYRGEADYRQALFMQGQDTLVVIGGLLDDDDETRVGAGAILEVQSGGDAKYIGVESDGLAEMRSALENDRKEAADIGGKLLDTTGGGVESGEALRIRVSARTASLNQIARAGAEGLQSILRIMARWIGANPEEVIVEPNLDFAADELESSTLEGWMKAKMLGLPLSKQSIHEKMQEKDMTSLSFEEEMQLIAQEDADDLGGDGLGVEDDGLEQEEDE